MIQKHKKFAVIVTIFIFAVCANIYARPVLASLINLDDPTNTADTPTGSSAGSGTVSSGGGSTGSGAVSSGGGSSGSGSVSSGSFYLQDPLGKKFTSVGDLIDGFVGIFTYLAVLAAVLMIIYVGLRFVLAQGNVEELKTRKNQLLWIMVGVAVVIGARLLVSVVLNTLKATGTVNSTVIDSANNALQTH